LQKTLQKIKIIFWEKGEFFDRKNRV